MIKRIFAAAALLAMIGGSALAYDPPECNADICAGTDMVGNTPYPMVEMISHDTFTIPGDGAWHRVAPQCVLTNLDTVNTIRNVRASQPFNLAMQAQLQFITSGVSVGARYEVQFILRTASGTEIEGGWYAKTIRAIQAWGSNGPPDSRPNASQGDFFHGSEINMLAGDYTYYLKVKLNGGGSMSIQTMYLSGLGSPTTYGGGRYGYGVSQTIGSTSWMKAVELAAPNLLPNSSGAPADYVLQGYIEITSGRPGDRLSVGFGYDDLSSGAHYQEIYVPNELPTGIHIRDVIPNQTFTGIPTGPGHRLQMWIKNQSGGTTTIGNAELQAIGYKPMFTAGTSYTYATDVKTVSSTTTEAQPGACIMTEQPPIGTTILACGPNLNECGKWTKLLTLTPMSLSNTQGTQDELPVFETYVELLGHTGTWNNSTVEVGIEITYPPYYAFESGVALFDLPSGTAHLSFTDGPARLVHLQATGQPAIVNLWIRKLTCWSGGEVASFQVGKRFLGVHSAPAPDGYCTEAR